MTGIVELSALVPGDNVFSRLVTVTVNGVALPPIEAIDTQAMFPCNDGDLIVVVDVDANSAGSSSPSDPFSITAHLPISVPAQPQVLSVTFA